LRRVLFRSDCLSTQYPHAVKFSPIEHHLMESDIVGRGGSETSRAGKIIMRRLDVATLGGWRLDELDLVTVGRVGLIVGRKTIQLRGGYVEMGVAHLERLEDLLTQVLVEGHSGYYFHEAADDVGSGPVLPRFARIEVERHR